MTGPKDPDEPSDWTFPEVAAPDAAGPASVDLPLEAEPVYDTGSDAWWRAQAEAQRRAAQSEPAVTPAPPVTPAPIVPPPLVPPEVLQAAAVPVEPSPLPPDAVQDPPPSPLDSGWLPPDLPELRADPVDEPRVDLDEGAPDLSQPAATEAEPALSPPEQVQPATGTPDRHVQAPARRTGASVADLPLAVPLTRPALDPVQVGPARAVAGAVIAVAGVALAVGALLLLGKDEPKTTPTVDAGPTHSTTAGPTPTASERATPTSSPTSVVVPPPTAAATQAPIQPVDVLNNSRVKGLADSAARRFRAGGWPVPLKASNYSGGTLPATTVYYAPGQLGSAQRFAKQFGISRVLPRFAGLPGSGLTVVLTRDYR